MSITLTLSTDSSSVSRFWPAQPCSNVSADECAYVRFGSKADICSAKRHVRFTPDNNSESGFPHKVMSALPPKADMCSALAHVCFGPKADIGLTSNEHSNAWQDNPELGELARPRIYLD